MSRGGPLGDDVDVKNVPTGASSDPERRAWLRALFSLGDGFTVGDVVRFGGASRSPMTVEVVPPGNGRAMVVRFEEEREVGNPKALRTALARDAGLRGAPITAAKTAGDAYYVLCALARVIGRLDPRAEAGEWIDEYQRVGKPIEGHELTRRGTYPALNTLRHYPYSKRAINLYASQVERGHADPRDVPRPPLLIDEPTGRAWTSVTHLGTFIRHDRDRAEGISDAAMVGRILEHGCERRDLNVWDRSDRQRKDRIKMVLVGFPEPAPAPDDDVDTDEDGEGV